jgi:hypothetical protein
MFPLRHANSVELDLSILGFKKEFGQGGAIVAAAGPPLHTLHKGAAISRLWTKDFRRIELENLFECRSERRRRWRDIPTGKFDLNFRHQRKQNLADVSLVHNGRRQETRE